MIKSQVNIDDFSKILKNSVSYSQGFFQGSELNQISFNQSLGQYTLDILNKYIDSKAKMSYDQLHHVYEWGMTGSSSGRLFDIKVSATKSNIIFYGTFLPSRTVSETGTEPFVDKASIMENGISIIVSPVFSDVLAFEVDGETVFTAESIVIENPGGDEVAGSFGRVVSEFFDSYFTNVVLKQSGILRRLQSPREFSDFFPSGARGGGRNTGITAGRKYMTIKGDELA